MGDVNHDMVWWHYILLLLVLIAGFVIIYRIHWSYNDVYIQPHDPNLYVIANHLYYPYPLHADEWLHLAQADYMMQTSSLKEVNPYKPDVARLDLESGFHAFLAAFFTATNLDPIFYFQFLPALFVVFAMLALFILVFSVVKNYFVALASSLFLVFVKSNLNITGLWFLVPLTFSLFMLFGCLAAYLNKQKLIAALVFVAALLSYPFAAMAIAFVIIIYEAIHALINRKYGIFSYWRYYLPIIAVLCVIVLNIYKWNISAIPFLYSYGWTVNFEQVYMPWDMYSWILCALALIGAIYAVWKKKFWEFLIMPAIFIIPMLMYMSLRFSLAFPYQRAYLYFVLSLAPLSAIGLFALYSIIKGITKHPIPTFSFTVIIVLAAIIVPYSGYYHVDDPRFRLVHYAESSDVEAMQWISMNFPGSTVLMADIFDSFVIYPLAHVQAVAVPPSNLEVGNVNSISSFYYNNADCGTKYNIMKNENSLLAFMNYPLQCPNMQQVYSKDGIYIYQLN